MRLEISFSNSEYDDDLRIAVVGRAEHLIDAGDSLDGVLDRLEDLALDSFRRRAGIWNANVRTTGCRDVRELVRLKQHHSAKRPNTTSATIVTTVIIGRLIAKSEMTIC